MIPVKELLPLTGYIRGGCSPVGMKKQFRTFFDETAILFDTIYVSGGKIGLQIEASVDSLLKITGGSIVFDGTDITSLPAKDRRKLMGSGIGLIPQNPGASFNPIRKLDVQFRESLAAHDMPFDENRIDDMLRIIGLQHGKSVLKNRPFELSGGMNQRIAIAAAMMFEPRLLLCDEATSALDVTTAGAVVEELLKIRKTNGTSILLVTHHLGIARKMADNIGIMKDGRLIEYGSTDKIFDSPENEYTKKLIRDVPRLKK
jgi:ABC-type dipeptide/oligopeptide/nickel transport system ATPase component